MIVLLGTDDNRGNPEPPDRHEVSMSQGEYLDDLGSDRPAAAAHATTGSVTAA